MMLFNLLYDHWREILLITCIVVVVWLQIKEKSEILKKRNNND